MIVIPMAGLSRRFQEAGYAQPKFTLMAHGRSLFRHAVESFAALFGKERFLFICRDAEDAPAFIARECAAMGLPDARTVALAAPTRGQAETVWLGLEQSRTPDDEPLIIFNIDTFRPGYAWPTDVDRRQSDGYLEVFPGSGPQWSYVRLAANTSNRVAETAEKREISSLCCTGLYSFGRAGDFRAAYAAQMAAGADSLHAGEIYVAPLYNFLIGQGAAIHCHVIRREDVIFCGVPAEYEAFLRHPSPPT